MGTWFTKNVFYFINILQKQCNILHQRQHFRHFLGSLCHFKASSNLSHFQGRYQLYANLK